MILDTCHLARLRYVPHPFFIQLNFHSLIAVLHNVSVSVARVMCSTAVDATACSVRLK